MKFKHSNYIHFAFTFFVILISQFLILNSSKAQLFDPVHWSFSLEQKSATEATLLFTAKMDDKWHIYSISHKAETGIATTFSIKKGKDFDFIGSMVEPKPIEEYDEKEKDTSKYFNPEVTFKQKIKIKSEKYFTIKGTLTYQTCKNDVGCLQPTDVDYSFDINKAAKDKVTELKTDSGTSIDTLNKTETINQITNSNTTTATTTSAFQLSNDHSVLEPECGGTTQSDDPNDLWKTFLLAFLGGFLALLTPCVFPMIPLTVSFFTKRSPTRAKGISNAFIYATSIIVIYVLLGLLITILFGSDALNDLASNGYMNMFFFIVFIIFALSFFGAFEIVLPSSWVNKADQKSEQGGLIGIFFMAFTLALVSFSCTGPIIGSLLVTASRGGYLGPAIGMFGFSLALALPFALFAAFPGWLNSLPKSGGWLNTVKVVLGFLELALALKFLSNVDLAYHWGFLKREIFIALWIIIFGLCGIYLLGKLRFSHDSEVKHTSTGRLIFGILFLSFTIYLVPGLWGAPLRLISGFPPPEFYKEWVTSPSECPHDLTCFHDLDEGVAYARAQGKPIMIDFTGWNCVNCRRMEDNVWSQPKVLKKLREDYIIISLYVDDKKELPEKEITVSKFSGKKLKTVGNKWSDLEASMYNKNSQPYYVLVDHSGKLLAQPVGFTDVETYSSFLEEGLCRFKKRMN
ncbi:MAG: cytochrome c biogenesis protein CcdA [Bacteroidia bacterium]